MQNLFHALGSQGASAFRSFLDNPIQFSFHLSMFGSLLLCTLLPGLEERRTVAAKTEDPDRFVPLVPFLCSVLWPVPLLRSFVAFLRCLRFLRSVPSILFLRCLLLFLRFRSFVAFFFISASGFAVSFLRFRSLARSFVAFLRCLRFLRSIPSFRSFVTFFISASGFAVLFLPWPRSVPSFRYFVPSVPFRSIPSVRSFVEFLTPPQDDL